MDLRDLLVHTALDPALRDALRADPDATLSAYTLTPDEREAILAADASLLPHLARVALAGDRPSADHAAEAPAAPALPAAGPAATELRLTLRPLVGPGLAVAYHATVHTPVAHPISPLAAIDDAVTAVRSAAPADRLDRLRALLARL